MTAQWRNQIGRFGVWRRADQTTPGIAAGLEALGYGAVWLGSSPDGDLAVVDGLLAATRTLTVGTSIVNMWKDDAATVAQSFARIEASYPHRFILGVGAGHPEATAEYASPYQTLARYVGQLLADGVPAESIVLAALGPRVLGLAGQRAGGAIPYLVPPAHTKMAREILGPGPLLAPEHKAVLSNDLAEARSLARHRVANPYLRLSNYTSNLRRLGFSAEDLAGSGSDALVDALVAHGSSDEVAEQLSGHLEAGADHVCIQLLTDSDTDPMPGYSELASALGL
ncbi:MAG TPA: LLM class F420-dependent oxidoreductase [Streptosporangiaceae bacterium]|jgi:probable F420-dependent oxidoreductase